MQIILSWPKFYGVPQAVLCGQDWIAVQPVGDRRGGLSARLRELTNIAFGHARPTIERIGDGVVYARLPTFSSANYRDISHNSWASRQSSDRVLIVDLRNNSGGERMDRPGSNDFIR